MRMGWHDLLFAHWPFERSLVQAHLPNGMSVDTFDGQAWIAVVPFRMTDVAPRGVPAIPWMSAFPELNVRTYVSIDDKPGVLFFSLDATNPFAVRVARDGLSLAVSGRSHVDRIRWRVVQLPKSSHTSGRTIRELRGALSPDRRLFFRPTGDARTLADGTILPLHGQSPR